LRDSLFSIGLQGISMNQSDQIEQTIDQTFVDAYQNGFPEERLQAILHKTELGLKKQVAYAQKKPFIAKKDKAMKF